jgi:hypothetical protein
MSDGGVSLDRPERMMGRRWLAVAGAAVVAGASSFPRRKPRQR